MGKSNLSKKEQEERAIALKSLPPSVRNSLTDEEKELFLHAEVWPESMFEKLDEFILGRDDS